MRQLPLNSYRGPPVSLPSPFFLLALTVINTTTLTTTHNSAIRITDYATTTHRHYPPELLYKLLTAYPSNIPANFALLPLLSTSDPHWACPLWLAQVPHTVLRYYGVFATACKPLLSGKYYRWRCSEYCPPWPYRGAGYRDRGYGDF